MSRFSRLGHALYTGEVSYNFIGRRRRWYIVSAILIAVSLLSLGVRQLNFGIEFIGGADFKAATTVTTDTVNKMHAALGASGVPDLNEASVTTIGTNQVRVQTRTLDPVTEVPKVRQAIAKEAGVAGDQVAYSLIGGSWGSQITERALIALVVFLALVSLIIGIYFRNWKMSLAALIALIHDLILTVGIYALVGFTVTPATVIGVLTILGYSLYDTVVVFDKVRENVRDLSSATKTYSEAANLAVNQVLVRSINTTVIGVLPVAALLFAGAFILGEGPLKDLALALFVGMVSGAYSSIFIATPLLAQLKEREPDMQKLARRVAARKARDGGTAGGRRSGGTGTGTGTGTDVRPERDVLTIGDETDDGEQPGRGRTKKAGPSNQPATEEPATEVGRMAGTRITLSSTSGPASGPGSIRPLSDGAAKRPQPQHKPRSHRKK